VVRLRASGAYVFGKTVTTPLAYMDPSRTRNPWNGAHSPGGSSSGSAAAVAAGHVLATIGTQTNGSIIRPAAYCGVVGYKPTVGAIPVAGVHPFAPTFDTVGTFARTVSDAARVASVLTDRGRIAAEVAYPAHRPRFAWLAKFPWVEPDYETLRMLAHALETLRDAAEIVPIAIPSAWKEAKATHRALMLKEGSEVLGALQDRERHRLTPAINAAIDDGHAISSEAHRDAVVTRERGIAFFTGWLDEYDAVLSPSAPSTAPRGLDTTGDPSCCSLWSLLGFPAINIPAGLVGGLPVGLQLAAPQGRDDSLLSAAAWCEARIAFEGLHTR
jgi:amidase